MSDERQMLDDGGLLATTSGFGKVAGIAAVVDLGASPYAGVLYFTILAIDSSSSNDITFSVQGSTTEDFSGPVQTLAICEPVIVGQLLAQLYSVYNLVNYRYIRLVKTLVGPSPSVKAEVFCLPLSAIDELSTAELGKVLSFSVDTFKGAVTNFQAWITGTATGGPNGDGQYPLQDGSGDVILMDCPAKTALKVEQTTGTVGDFYRLSGYDIGDLGVDSPSLGITIPDGIVVIDGKRTEVTGAHFTLVDGRTYDFWANAAGTVESYNSALAPLPFFGDKLLLYRITTFTGIVYAKRVMSQSAPWIRGEHAAIYRPRDFLRDFVIPSGDYAGAWAYGLNNGPEQYFGCIAMSLIGPIFPQAAKAYLQMIFDKFIVGSWVSQGNWTKGQHMARDGYIFIAQNAGQSAISDPFSGSHGLGTTVTDGAVTWKTVATVPSEWVWFVCDHFNQTGLDQAAYRPPDSNDAYGAMLSFAVYIMARAGVIDETWLNAASLYPSSSSAYYTRKALLDSVIYWNCRFYVGDGTGSPPSTLDMSQTFQAKKAPDGTAYDIQFTQDNLEVYQGLKCAAWVWANIFADATQAGILESAATDRLNALPAHYDAGYGFYKSNNTETFASVNTGIWYPFAVTQIMAQAYNVDLDYASFKGAVNLVFENLPRWWKNAVDDFPTIVEAYTLCEGGGLDHVLRQAMVAHEELFIEPHDGRWLVHHAAAYLAGALCVRRPPPSF